MNSNEQYQRKEDITMKSRREILIDEVKNGQKRLISIQNNINKEKELMYMINENIKVARANLIELGKRNETDL